MDKQSEIRCRKYSGNRRCRRLALEDGHCELHQKSQVDMGFWQAQSEEQRLAYLQKLAEIRAINVHKLSTISEKEADLIFNRNVRMAATISKLRQVMEYKEVTSNKSDKWLEVLQNDTEEAIE
ncbi:MAG: hypothetical protein ACK5MJ_03270 [Alphaproteobacteria bacterium]